MKKRRLIFSLVVLITSSSIWATTFTTDTFIAADDPNYDGQDIIVDGCTLTVNGQHIFNSLQVINSAIVTHSPAPNGESENRIDLTISVDLLVDSVSQILANGKGYSGVGGGTGNGPNNSSSFFSSHGDFFGNPLFHGGLTNYVPPSLSNNKNIVNAVPPVIPNPTYNTYSFQILNIRNRSFNRNMIIASMKKSLNDVSFFILLFKRKFGS